MNVLNTVRNAITKPAINLAAKTPLARKDAERSAVKYPDCMELVMRTCECRPNGDIVLKSSGKIIGHYAPNGYGWMSPKGYELMKKDAEAMGNDDGDIRDDYDDGYDPDCDDYDDNDDEI